MSYIREIGNFSLNNTNNDLKQLDFEVLDTEIVDFEVYRNKFEILDTSYAEKYKCVCVSRSICAGCV